VAAYGRPSFGLAPASADGEWVLAVRLSAVANPRRSKLFVSSPLPA
jgi:hypothetical protein